MQTLTSILQYRAVQNAEEIAYEVIEGDSNSTSITYQQLYYNSMRVASSLNKILPKNSTSLILLPPGEEYIYAFFGCLLAGIIAIPAYPTRNNQHTERLKNIIHNAEAGHIITTASLKEKVSILTPKISCIEEILLNEPAGFNPIEVDASDIAFLQYTSGSTGNPKGVIMAHANLIENCHSMHKSFAASSEDIFGS